MSHPITQDPSPDQNRTEQDAPTARKATAVLAAERHPLIIAALVVVSLGLYMPFWLVARVQEFNKLQTKVLYRPWLWFFAPLVVIAQLIALPKFFNQLQSLSEQQGISLPRIHGTLWILILVITSLVSAIEMKYEIPIWASLLSLIAGVAALAWSQHWFNQLKRTLTAVEFKRPQFVLNVFEWLAVVVGLAIWTLAVIGFSGGVFPAGETLKVSHYTLPEHEFSLPIKGEYWRADVPDGEDAIAIIYGKLFDMQFDLYHYGFNESLDSVSYWRQESIREYLSSVTQCNHERFFDEGSSNVIAFVVCTGTDILDPAIHTVTVIDTPNKGVYELYGQFSAPKLSFKQYQQDVLDMAKGFRPQ